ncbi:MAG: hypothetical protein GXP04_04335 [Alphaproteobacteria bacterium]|nr:hypothetical protein [Marinicaulis sp.]NOX94332.1 hypothetical protein [Alphaproteobacteria bacterium]
MTTHMPYRLILIGLFGALFMMFTLVSANAHKGHQEPDPEPVQVEKTADNNTDDGHMEGDAHDGEAHESDEHDTSSAAGATNEAAGGHHGAAETLDDETKTFSERLTSWLGSFHPAAVHIPIGLLIAALLGELLLMVTGQPVYASIVRYCIWIGALGALIAAPLGWLSAGFQLTDAKEIITTHRWVGTSAATWSIILLFILGATKEGGSRTLLRLALLIGAGLVAYNGYLGGLIIHGLDAHAF